MDDSCTTWLVEPVGPVSSESQSSSTFDAHINVTDRKEFSKEPRKCLSDYLHSSSVVDV